VRLAFAVILGVVTTLGFQSYHDTASEMIRTAAPSLAWLLPVSAAQSPVSSATLPELVEQLKPISLDLAIVRRSLEQLAANQNQLANSQEQVVQNLTTMQEVEQEIRQGLRTPPRKSSPSAGQPLR
jgi:predicted negative regulator of RcsB-dependent stress response